MLHETRGAKTECAFRSMLSACPQALASGQRVVIDLDFEGLMTPAELSSICNQLMHSYSANSRAATPCHLHFTSVTVRACLWATAARLAPLASGREVVAVMRAAAQAACRHGQHGESGTYPVFKAFFSIS